MPLVGPLFLRGEAGCVKQKVETITGQTVTYDYDDDAMGRLETVYTDGASVESYAYDFKGRRETATARAGFMGMTTRTA